MGWTYAGQFAAAAVWWGLAFAAGVLFLQMHHAVLVMHRVIVDQRDRDDALERRIERLERDLG